MLLHKIAINFSYFHIISICCWCFHASLNSCFVIFLLTFWCREGILFIWLVMHHEAIDHEVFTKGSTYGFS